jgi:N-acetylmuramoyl-L-alanine amidase CwlA
MTIKQYLVPPEKYALKCPNAMSPIGICVHNTANDAPAKNEITYMVNNANQTSFHIAVDDVEAWQGLPLDRNGWHAGDGNGEGNRKHIGIEICYSKSGGEKFTKAEENAAEVIAQLLKQFGWGVERVKKHQDFSGKYCPHRTLDLGWDRFINKVRAKMGESGMPNMYGTPNQYDLSNPESMKVAVDKLNEVLTGVYIKKTDAEATLNTEVNKVKAQLTEANNKVNVLIDNQKALAIILGLPESATKDQILGEVKTLVDEANNEDNQNSSPIGTLPATIEVNGEVWGLNGVNLVDGKLQGNYKRN